MSGAKCSWQAYNQQTEGTLVFLWWLCRTTSGRV